MKQAGRLVLGDVARVFGDGEPREKQNKARAVCRHGSGSRAAARHPSATIDIAAEGV